MAASLTGPRLAPVVRERLPQAGALTAAAGLVAAGIVVLESSGGSVSLALILATLPIGAGMGLAVPSTINLILASVPPADAGAASGMLTTSQQVGNALGVGLVGTVFFAALGSRAGAGAYGHALAVSMALQATLALASAALITRARVTAPRAAPAEQPA